ncbi:zf-HC2 domain-containing protein [Actinoplanes sp. NPDC051411]|uniref:zf-HC2 domain-containing protein n=1 Tax=Actinoplanes sp. NPDC051411 TaxID=3155522 RepID=UPI00342F864D
MSGHESELLGAYVLGVLDGEEWATVRSHLDSCEACRREVDDLREMEAALGEIPPEALLDGPPPEGSGLLQLTLSDVRESHRSRGYLWVLAGVAVFVIALAGGISAGRFTSPAAATAAPAPSVSPVAATDPRTGVSMTVAVTPAAGWVRVHAVLSGVPAGEQCRIFVVSADGGRQQAASWLAAAGPMAVDGSALMAPADVTSVQAETYAGQILVTVPV